MGNPSSALKHFPTKRSEPGRRDESLIELAGSIIVPWDSWWVWAVAGGPTDCPNKDIYRKVLERAKAAWEFFEPLAARAGAHLPSAMRQALPYEPADGESWWFNVLWWLHAPDEWEVNSQKQQRRLVSMSPFDDSARAIELCGLTGDAPAFPLRVRFADNGDILFEKDDNEKSENKGGRPPEREALWKVIQRMDKQNPKPKDQTIANTYNQEQSRPIAERKLKSATAEDVASVRYERSSRPPRKQNPK